jgi:hypothetical protein
VRLYQDLYLAAAGEPDLDRHFVGDPVADEPRLAASHDLHDVLGQIPFHTTAGDRAGSLSTGAHGETGAGAPGRRAANAHQRGNAARQSSAIPAIDCRLDLVDAHRPAIYRPPMRGA